MADDPQDVDLTLESLATVPPLVAGLTVAGVALALAVVGYMGLLVASQVMREAGVSLFELAGIIVLALAGAYALGLGIHRLAPGDTEEGGGQR